MADIKTKEFKSESRKALNNPQIQKSLVRVIDHFGEARVNAIEEITPEVWEILREKARTIKTHTMSYLDHYLDLMETNVRKNGGVMHFAKDAAEANAIVASLISAKNAKSVIKSKSMISEEMGLNHVLEDMNVDVAETDLGEYIIQLAEETPFHIIAPAMHKSKEEVAKLFVEKAGTKLYKEIPELAEASRHLLREKFQFADVGITGANFMVAETGTLVLVTNEGNGRMCTSAPKMHIALAGMEKMLPSLEDLGVFLRLLARSATGQRLTSYTTFVSGPKREHDKDGPEEFHLIVVDNGRSKMLQDVDLREALNCIRCGACLNNCPIYQNVGGHAYGWVYSGPIGAVVTPMLVGLEQSKDLPFASTLCGRCKEVCPVKINIPHMLLRLRNKSTQNESPGDKPGVKERVFFSLWFYMVKSKFLYKTSGRMGSGVQKILRTLKLENRIPFFGRWTRSRDLPLIPTKSFRDRWKDVGTAK